MKPAEEFFDANGRRKVRGNMAIDFALDAMDLAEHIDPEAPRKAATDCGSLGPHEPVDFFTYPITA
jgi:hypothetical protein